VNPGSADNLDNLGSRVAMANLALMEVQAHRGPPVPREPTAPLEIWDLKEMLALEATKEIWVLLGLKARLDHREVAVRWAGPVHKAPLEFAASPAQSAVLEGLVPVVSQETMDVLASKVRLVLPVFKALLACLELPESRAIVGLLDPKVVAAIREPPAPTANQVKLENQAFRVSLDATVLTV